MAIAKLNDWQKLCARLRATTSITNSELAKTAGVSYNHMCKVVSDPLFVREVGRIREKAETKILDKQEKAMNRLYGSLDDLMDDLIKIARNEDVSPTVRRQAIVDALSYGIRKKGEEREKEHETPYLGIQHPDNSDLEEDADVTPAANPRVIEFREAAANG